MRGNIVKRPPLGEDLLDWLNHDSVVNSVIDILAAEQNEALSAKSDVLSDKRHNHPATHGYCYGGFEDRGAEILFHHGWTLKGAWITMVPGFWKLIGYNTLNQAKKDRTSYPKPKVNTKVLRKVTAYGVTPSRDIKEGDYPVGEWPSHLSRFTGNCYPLMDIGNVREMGVAWERSSVSFVDIKECCELARTIALNMCESVGNDIGLSESARFDLKTVVLGLPIAGCMIASDKYGRPTKFGGTKSDLKSKRVTFVETQGDISIQAKSEFGQKYKTPRLIKDASLLIPADKWSWMWARWRIVTPVGLTWNMSRHLSNLRYREKVHPSTKLSDISAHDTIFRATVNAQMESYGDMHDSYDHDDRGLLPITWNDFTTQVGSLRIIPSAIREVVANIARHLVSVDPPRFRGVGYRSYVDTLRSRYGLRFDGSWNVGIPVFGYTTVKTAKKASAKSWDVERSNNSHYGRHRIITKPSISMNAKVFEVPPLVEFARRKPKQRSPPHVKAFRRKNRGGLDEELQIARSSDASDFMEDL
jgi:hypothetical protein